MASLATIALANEDHNGKAEDGHGTTVSVPAGSQIQVTLHNDGAIHVNGLKAVAINGTTISGQVAYGTGVLNVAVTTDSNTKFTRRYGGASSLSQFVVGDYLAVDGTLTVSGNTFTIAAKKVEDNSIQMRNDSFGGIVSSVNTASSTFVLTSHERGMITVTITGSTKFFLNNSTTTSSQVVVGAWVVATGLFNNLNRTVVADKVQIKESSFVRKTKFEGTLKSVSTTTLPSVLIVTIGEKDITVNVPVGISVVNKKHLPIAVATLKAGDKLRVYGVVETTNNLVIDASIIRDVSSR